MGMFFRVCESGLLGRRGDLVEGALDVQDGRGTVRVYVPCAIKGQILRATWPGEVEPATQEAVQLARLVADMRAGWVCPGIPIGAP